VHKRKYKKYKDYIDHQKEKTQRRPLRKKLLKKWPERRQKFLDRFKCLEKYNIVSGKVLCLAARMGCEVKVLRELGFDAVGIDLVAAPPLVEEGDFHNLRFGDNSFDLVFSNSIDHVHPERVLDFVSEIRRVLKPNGHVLFDVTFGSFGNYESLRIDSVEELIKQFDGFSLIHKHNYNQKNVTKKHSLSTIFHHEILLRLEK